MAMKPIVLPITYKSDPKGLRKAEQDIKGFASGVSKAIGGATLAVAAIGGASLKAFADFDSAMTQSLAIMGDVSDTMKGQMSDAAREVAKTTTFSANQAAESYYFLASAGLDAAASVQAMPKVAAFAQAGMFDMAQATDLLTDAQSALGLTVDDTAQNTQNMTRVSDVLVKANTLANASVEQFSSALTNKAGAAMKSVGMDIEEGVAVLAAFADQGIKGEYAGTQFGIVLRDLQSKAIENADAFKRAGVQVFDASGEMNNMADIIGSLEDRLGGMSDEQKKVELSTMGFTDKSVASILALMGTSDAIREYEQGLRDAGGTTDEVANKQLESLASQFELLKSEIIDVGLSIGESLEPTFKDLVGQLKPVIQNIGNALVPAFKALAPVIMMIVGFLPQLITALTPMLPIMVNIASSVFQLAGNLLPLFLGILEAILPILDGFTQFLANNSEFVATLVVGIGSLVVIITTFNKIIGIAKLAVAAFNAILAMNPIGLIILAVAALTAALVYFFTQTEVGKEAWSVFVNWLTETTTAIGEWFAYVFGEWFPGLWQGMLDFFSNGWDTFKEYFFGALGAIGDFFKGIVNGWITLFEGFVNTVISGVNGLINGINKISLKIPKTKFTDKMTIGFNIPNIPTVKIPRLANGGIVPAQPGGILANIGEGRYNEAVVPLKPGVGLGNTYNITVNAGMGTDGRRVGEQIVKAIRQYERTSGPVFASA